MDFINQYLINHLNLNTTLSYNKKSTENVKTATESNKLKFCFAEVFDSQQFSYQSISIKYIFKQVALNLLKNKKINLSCLLSISIIIALVFIIGTQLSQPNISAALRASCRQAH